MKRIELPLDFNYQYLSQPTHVYWIIKANHSIIINIVTLEDTYRLKLEMLALSSSYGLDHGSLLITIL